MSAEPSHIITVVDFRRRRMAVRWDVSKASWSSDEEAVTLVHGIVLVRPGHPAICLYGYDAQLNLQIGSMRLALGDHEPRVLCEPELLSAGLRRMFRIESGGATLYRERYWAGNAPDFFRALAEKSADREWRLSSARLWSDGIDASKLREGWPS